MNINDDNFFWTLIEEARINNDQEDHYDALIERLSALSKNALVYFEIQIREKVKALNNVKMVEYMRFVHGMPVIEDFLRFSGWIIAQGQQLYLRILENPDNFSEYIDATFSVFNFSFEDILEVADECFITNFGRISYDDLHLYILPSDFGETIFSYINPDATGIDDLATKSRAELIEKFPRTSKALNITLSD